MNKCICICTFNYGDDGQVFHKGKTYSYRYNEVTNEYDVYHSKNYDDYCYCTQEEFDNLFDISVIIDEKINQILN